MNTSLVPRLVATFETKNTNTSVRCCILVDKGLKEYLLIGAQQRQAEVFKLSVRCKVEQASALLSFAPKFDDRQIERGSGRLHILCFKSYRRGENGTKFASFRPR